MSEYLGNGNWKGRTFHLSMNMFMTGAGFGELSIKYGNGIVVKLQQKHCYKTTTRSHAAGAIKKSVLKHLKGGKFNFDDALWLVDRGVVIEGFGHQSIQVAA